MSPNERLFLAINHLAHRNGVLDIIMVLSAQYIPFLLAALLLGAWFWRRARHVSAAFRAALSGLLALSIAPLLGLLHYQPLPFVLGLGEPLISHEANNSFPSDHASLAFAVAVSLLLSGDGLGPYALSLAVLVGFARLFVGVHLPSDVLAGALLGTLVALLIHLLGGQIDRLATSVYKVQQIVFKKLRRHLHRGEG